MPPRRLREQILPEKKSHSLVRASVGREVFGHVFATRWLSGDKQICWITQLCVGKEWRRKGVATEVSVVSSSKDVSSNPKASQIYLEDIFLLSRVTSPITSI